MTHELHQAGPARLFLQAGGVVAPGATVGVTAPPGVGKSAWLVHVALDALLAGGSALHVSVRDSVDRVRAGYDELLAARARGVPWADRSATLLAAERGRMIQAYRDRAFDVAHFVANLDMLERVAGFAPSVVVFDAIEANDGPLLASLVALAQARGFVLWVASSSPMPEVDVWVALEARGASIAGAVCTAEGRRPLSALLHVESLLPLGEGAEGGSEAPAPRLGAAACTLYSGGANGAEELFGAAAEAWGLAEVCFSFEGHRQAHSRGRVELTAAELAAGDVSLRYVSGRLARTYAEGSLIRKVLQTLWHMVSRSEQVFVLGVIQPDLTVRGGTGWAVELARMWNKDLWVFDQERVGWFHWDGAAFEAGAPRVTASSFVGTGTRYPTDEASAAVEALFEASFGPKPGGARG